ncbi:E3 ubiquitin-protein ligase znrf2 [Sitodiplosis mosellana]|uniref:E3 ubiquitin-protein ligase znrf2 n=1 Tax=Sitodiplosis mosellana TaxID=263140 RepID=UPI002444A010|nr:E3 ubiquitin-protein ligase znrf2 [Sitodiplosis mosellana]XP_055296993.1 E3 ubiquitin-protein ligase znrf2 [Sitodiplosis mosellana]XP_055296994.1 E3 ubiquitin-protein ligase znrf2 [Sitodiplosis mosellana]XP_055296995.1 E3 ubiquitin-protein ligase znrf2 [Sitodiplosis mosellana]
MGAKTSTANGSNGTTSSGPHHQHHVHSQQHNSQSPRTRTFSTSSSSATEVIPAGSSTATGFSLLRSIPGMHVTAANQSTIDRQRARSLSSVPDLQQSNSNGTTQSNYLNAIPQIQSSNIEAVIQQATLAQDGDSIAAATAGAIALGRVYTATSLPSHIWSLNGIKCPVCSKFVLPDDIECHLVMCLTKPRLSYNEDVLTDAKGECVICLEDLNAGDVIARLPCLCIYHKGCIDQWFEVNRSCPEHPGD